MGIDSIGIDGIAVLVLRYWLVLVLPGIGIGNINQYQYQPIPIPSIPILLAIPNTQHQLFDASIGVGTCLNIYHSIPTLHEVVATSDGKFHGKDLSSDKERLLKMKF